jgi:hypothetical protein
MILKSRIYLIGILIQIRIQSANRLCWQAIYTFLGLLIEDLDDLVGENDVL